MIIDCPAGVGQAIPALKTIYKKIDGAILVTTPAKVATENTEGVIILLNDLKIPILGILANMTYFQCTNCDVKHYFYGVDGVKTLAERHSIPQLGNLPFDLDIPHRMDKGMAINHEVLVKITDLLKERAPFLSKLRQRFKGG